ncbi:GxxExxY protein [Tichowtungia aerotolerans]|uniref:GxxExxY protein n=1 Tax=Tichowtungia aerotolerans TaxID=2697043 RepID=A0A6P1M574_9BACT|nr:GxxExxY protein [Tichowtungia aerotolerans]QHI69202.1 GxxExxY protein [Tichowtungia aerotolerans]
MSTNKDILYKEESFAIIGACFNVYNDKGCGFLEPVYQECMEIELKFQNIPSEPQRKLDLFYRDQKLEHFYQPDFVCFEKIILELKAVDKIMDAHRAQVLNYLHATGFKLGIIVNFGHYPDLEYERVIL